MAISKHTTIVEFFFIIAIVSLFLSKSDATIIYPVQDADYAITGMERNSLTGLSARGLGDVNGDGFNDIILESRTQLGSGKYGKVYIIFGPSTSWAITMDLNMANTIIQGETTEDDFGYNVNSGIAYDLDVNGDGIGDLIAGAAGAYTPNKGYLILGSRNNWYRNMSVRDSDSVFMSNHYADFLGDAMEKVGDVNGDGFDDFAIGARFNEDRDFFAGKTYIFLGKHSGWTKDVYVEEYADASYRGDYGDKYGSFISGAGDLDRDGYDDFLVSYTTYRSHGGGVHLIYGRKGPWFKNLPYELDGCYFKGEDPPIVNVHPGDRAGRCVTTLGDINNDGFSDFIVGANGNDENGDNSGKCYIFLGNPYRWVNDENLTCSSAYLLGEYQYDLLGISAAALGDVNGDGYDDFIISADESDRNGQDRGSSYLFLGKPNGWNGRIDPASADYIFVGENDGDNAGTGLAYIGDLDNDYYDDILIASIFNSDAAYQAGKVYIITSLFQNTKPTTISRVTLKSDETYTGDRTLPITFGEDLYIEVTGPDADHNSANTTEVLVSTNKKPYGIKVRCIETGPNTGIFRRSIWITDKGSNFMCRRIGAYPNDWLTIISRQDSNITVTYPVRNPTPTPIPTPTFNPGPKILLGGYWDTSINYYSYQPIDLVYLIGHSQEGWTEHLELRHHGTGANFWWAGNMEDLFFFTYGFQGDWAPYIGQYLLEVTAWDYDGVPSNVWPYLTVE